ncbi:hypothetical protein [Nonomuraea sp. NPDC049607]|uniref:hypothetical protein n=1 Tax=Nonomuraea sp. NPDC049607 TaxID=3154732 RepID=UPI00341C8BF3
MVDALVAVKAGLLVDPDHRPDGPTQEDLPLLLAGLLAKVELEMATLLHPLEQEDGAAEAVAAYLAGWHEVVHVGEDDRDLLVLQTLASRLRRTVTDLDHATGGTAASSGDQPIVVQAALNALLAAAAFP